MNKKLPVLRVIALIIILILAVAYLFQMKIDYPVTTYAKIVPGRQWIVMRGNDGLYISTTRNNLNGVNSSYTVNQFERGASVNVELRPGLKPDFVVKPGDTLGIIYSSTNLQRYTDLQGQLKVAKADLDVALTGEKESVINAAARDLELSESNADMQSKVVARLKGLYDKKLASEEEYQLAADRLRSLNIEVELKKAGLEAAKTGLKSTEVQRLRAYIKSLEDQLLVIEKQLNMFNIIAPFAGRIERSNSADTLLIISCMDECLAMMPVSIEESKYIPSGSKITIKFDSQTIPASFLDINHSIEIVNNRQCVTLTALLDGKNKTALGMIVPVEIKGKRLMIYEYLISLLS